MAASRATGVDRQTIAAGVEELEAALEGRDIATKRIRRPGGGRTKTVEKNPELWNELEKLIEPVTRGDPESPLRWTCKSTRRLAEELKNMGHEVSYRIVAELLVEHGYSLQANQKTIEGDSHPDRNEQFEHINAKAEEFLKAGEPVISVDTKKRNWSDPLKTVDANCGPKDSQKK